MSNNKQTAVEYLEKAIDKYVAYIEGYHNAKIFTSSNLYLVIRQAKQMEKQQKIEFARHCLEKANRTFDLDILTSFIDVHQYYNEEYGSKESDKCCTPPGQIKRYIDCIGCDKNPKNNIKDYGKE